MAKRHTRDLIPRLFWVLKIQAQQIIDANMIAGRTSCSDSPLQDCQDGQQYLHDRHTGKRDDTKHRMLHDGEDGQNVAALTSYGTVETPPCWAADTWQSCRPECKQSL